MLVDILKSLEAIAGKKKLQTQESETRKLLEELFQYNRNIESSSSEPKKNNLSIVKPPGLLTYDIARYSNKAARSWVALQPTTRAKVLSVLRSITIADEGLIISKLFNFLNVLVELPSKINELNDNVEVIIENQEKMQKDLDSIKGRLEEIGNKIDEQIFVIARKGRSHLIDAATTDNEKVKEQELQLASNDFNTLINLDPTQSTNGTSDQSKNTRLIALGYQGKHLYFGIQGDLRNALIQVYKSTLLYPKDSLLVFSKEYYSKDYCSIIIDLVKQVDQLRALIQQSENDNQAKLSKYNSDQITKGVLGAVSWLGVASIGTLIGFPGPGAILGRLAYQNVVNDVKEPILTDTVSLSAKRDEIANKLNQIHKELQSECKMQLEILQKVTNQDLKALCYSENKD